MARKGERTYVVDLADIGLDLSASPRGLKGARAVISLNMDYSDASGALVGRRGTTTIAGGEQGSPLPGKPYDLYRAYNGIDGRYLLVVCESGETGPLDPGYEKWIIMAWKVGDAAFSPLQQGGGNFYLTENYRVSFTTDYDPNLGQTVVAFTNGYDQPAYWDFSDPAFTVVNFQFGTIDARLKKFIPTPFGFQGRGRRWAYLRSSELVTLHGSDPDDHTLFVDEGASLFFEVPAEDYSNPLRGIVPFKNQFTVFNLNSISTVYYTNNPDRFYNFNVQQYGRGAINDRCITYWDNNILFLDKRAPYLFLWDGARVHELDRDRMLTKGIQAWLDFARSSLLMMRMVVHEDTLFIIFTSSGKAAGSDAHKQILALNLTRQNKRGIPYFPATVLKLRANDIVVADGGTDFGQVYYTDDAENYVRRLYDFWDVATVGDPTIPYGDNNNQPGSDPIDITYRLMTGWIGGGDAFQATEFLLNADYEGTPAAGTTGVIRYRFNGWTEWQELLIGQVRKVDWIPFPKNAYGREIQFDLQWASQTARPILYDMKFKYVPRPMTRRLR